MLKAVGRTNAKSACTMTQSPALRSAERLDRALLRARLERARELKRQEEEERSRSATIKRPTSSKREPRAAPRAREDDELAACTGLEQCSVCCMDMEPDDCELQVLGCSHCFHRSCIAPWLKRSQTCPLCRQRVRVGVDVKAERPEAPSAAEAARPPARWESGTSASQARVEPCQRPRRKHACNAPSVILWSGQYYCEGCHKWLRYFEDPP